MHRQLVCSGQTAVDAQGVSQCHNDMGGQMALILDNLEALLQEARMRLADIVRLQIYVTDIAQARQNFAILTGRLVAAGVSPPMTLLEVSHLALPEFMIEIEAMAAD